MRIEHVLVGVALGCSGCANLTTQDRFSNLLRLTCDARSNAETTTLKAVISAMDAKDPAERLDLALTDRLSIRSGKYGAGLARHTDMLDLHDGESTYTHAYEAAIPTGPKLEMGFTRFEGEALWGQIVLPPPPELTLTGEGSQRNITWAKSADGNEGTLELFVACDDGTPVKDDPSSRGAPPVRRGVVGRHTPGREAGAIELGALLALAKAAPGAPLPHDGSKCASLTVVAARSSKVTVSGLGLGEAQCTVESSRSLEVPLGPAPDTTLTIPTETPR